MLIKSKPAISSKMNWWNMLTTLVQAADYFASTGLIPQPYGLIITGIGNILLRQITKQPISGIILPRA